MPTTPKSADIIRMEGKSHRTKKELRQREQAEKALLTGIPLKERQEVKDNEIAHKEFLRLKWLKELILQQAFRYEENRLLEINFQNARCTEDTNLNKYVNKKKSTGTITRKHSRIQSRYANRS